MWAENVNFVSEPSGSPQRVFIATVSQTTAVVDWIGPTCVERNGEIRNYEYEYEALDPFGSPWEQVKRGSSPQTQVELSNLVPDWLYRFRVRAVNSKGSGPYSEFVPLRTKPRRKFPL